MPDAYAVKLVDDDDLPADQSWAVVRERRGCAVAFVKRSALSGDVLRETWAAYQAIRRRCDVADVA